MTPTAAQRHHVQFQADASCQPPAGLLARAFSVEYPGGRPRLPPGGDVDVVGTGAHNRAQPRPSPSTASVEGFIAVFRKPRRSPVCNDPSTLRTRGPNGRYDQLPHGQARSRSKCTSPQVQTQVVRRPLQVEHGPRIHSSRLQAAPGSVGDCIKASTGSPEAGRQRRSEYAEHEPIEKNVSRVGHAAREPPSAYAANNRRKPPTV